MKYDTSSKSLIISCSEHDQIKELHDLKNEQVFVTFGRNEENNELEIVIIPAEYHMPAFMLDMYEPQVRMIISTDVTTETTPYGDKAVIKVGHILTEEEESFLIEHPSWILQRCELEGLLFASSVYSQRSKFDA